MSNIRDVPTLSYCTPDDVADTLDLPDPLNPDSVLKFTNLSHPSYNQVCRMIAANEDKIDKRIRRTWREHVVKDQLLDINTYWHDINGWRSDYYSEGGDFVQLRKDIKQWDPFPVCTYKRGQDGHILTETAVVDGKTVYVPQVTGGTIVQDSFEWVKGYNSDGTLMANDGLQVYVYSQVITGGTVTGQFTPATTAQVDKVLYGGDRLEMRTRTNIWRDMSMVPLGEPDKEGFSWNVWFDYPYGKLYVKTRFFQQRYNALRITYRYGSEEEVPYAITRLCALMTASQILNMQYFNIKVGSGGDLSQIRQATLYEWKEEMGEIWSSFQRSGSVHSMYR